MLIAYGLLHIFFSKGKYIEGVDHMNDVLKDNFKYDSLFEKKEYCLECNSARLVSFDHYKKRIETHNSLHEVPVNQNLANFIGCLNCNAQYKYQSNHKCYKYKDFYHLASYLLPALFSQCYFDHCNHLYTTIKAPENIIFIIIFVFMFCIHCLYFSFVYLTERWKPKLSKLHD